MSVNPRRVYIAPRPADPEGRAVHITAAMVPQLQAILGASLSDAGSAQYAEKNYNRDQPGGIDDQCWRFIAEIGELGHAYTWFSNSISRVRLYAATIGPDSVNVVPIEKGPAADIVNQLRWDSSMIMKEIAWNRLAVGRAYLLGTEIDDTFRDWSVYSTSQIRRKRRTDGNPTPQYQITHEGPANWVDLPENSLLSTIRVEDVRRKWLDWSPTKNILPILREIDLYNKKIIASLISRIVSRGILFIPAEVTFPSRKEQKDGADPFVEEFLDAAKSAIRDPSSAAAGLPLPLRVPATSIEKFRHMMLEQSEEVDTIKDRESALYRMADSLPIPRELVVGGLTKANHWTSWQLTEDAIKTYISPEAEAICRSLTKSFLWPQMKAEGHPIVDGDGNRTIIWYDATALTVSPDRSAQAREAFDRIEISGEAYRREIGFTEEDKPSPEEVAYRVEQKRLMDIPMSDGPVGEGDLIGDEKLGLPRTKGNQAPKVGQEA